MLHPEVDPHIGVVLIVVFQEAVRIVFINCGIGIGIGNAQTEAAHGRFPVHDDGIGT